MRPWTAIESGLCLNGRIADLETDFARWVYVACLLAADPYGCLEDDLRVLGGLLVPLLHRSPDELDAALWDLARVGLLARLEAPTGKRWLRIERWEEKATGKQVRRRGARRWPESGLLRETPGVSRSLQETPPTRARAVSCPVSGTREHSETEMSPQKGATRPARAPRGPSKPDQIVDRPVGVPVEAWSAWVEHQWARKKPTPGALDQHRAKLAALAEARGQEAVVAFIDQCIGANAQGIPGWAYDAALTGQKTLGGGGLRRIEPVSERLAREMREAGIQLE